MQTGELIGNLAKEKGINLRQLSIKADVPYNTLYAIVKRKSSRVDVETLLKIAKALDVHLRDLADNSWLEELDQRLGPEKLAELRTASKDSPIEIYLKSQGFSVESIPVKWHWENENDPPEERVQTVDEWEHTLSKDGHTATFTDAEFEELQAGAKEAIEGKFYKKVLEQQNK